MPEKPRSINLEIWQTHGQLRGRVAEADGPLLDFEGWLGLLSILGCLLDDAPPRPSPPPTAQTPTPEG